MHFQLPLTHSDVHSQCHRVSCYHSTQAFTDKSMDFQTKIIERSGLGDETYLPEGKQSEMLLCTPDLPCGIEACAGG